MGKGEEEGDVGECDKNEREERIGRVGEWIE